MASPSALASVLDEQTAPPPNLFGMGQRPSFSSMYPTVGMNTAPLPSASTPWYGEEPGIAANLLFGLRDMALQANQAMPWGGNDPSAIGIDTQAGTIDPNVMVPFATNVAGMVEAGNLAFAPAVKNGVGMGIRAYHGSPHDFDRFSMDKIGTGEGAQAYGHGLYFAENPGVAKSYKEALKWKGTDWTDPQSVASHWVEVYGGDVEKAKSHLRGAAKSMNNAGMKPGPEIQGALDWLEAGGELSGPRSPGRMYEVDIDASPDEFLDWDKPLSEQPKAVQDAVMDGQLLGESGVYEMDGRWVFHRPGSWGTAATREDAIKSLMSEVKGSDIVPQTPQSAEALRAAGIKGIRYKDAGSRTAEGGTHNYVVFDDSTINILKKYGLAGLTGGGAAAMALGGSSQDASAAQPTYRTGGGF